MSAHPSGSTVPPDVVPIQRQATSGAKDGGGCISRYRFTFRWHTTPAPTGPLATSLHQLRSAAALPRHKTSDARVRPPEGLAQGQCKGACLGWAVFDPRGDRYAASVRLSDRTVCLVVMVSAIVFGLVVPTALADGDPASDLLYQDNVYYPYQPAVSSSYVRDLNMLTQDAAQSGYPIKVAIIASPDDLGAAQDLWGRPQEYSQLLYSEITSYYTGPVLVVMPAGFGVIGSNLPPNAGKLLRGVSIDSSADSDSLAGSAIDGVQRLAASSGHPLPRVSSSSHRSSGAVATVLEIGGLVVVLALGVGGALTLRRRRGRPAPSPENL